MNFVQQHLAGQPDRVRRAYELGGIQFNGKHRGAEYSVICPFHDDHDPSMDVNLDSALFICRACGEKGDVVDLWARKRPKAEAIRELARALGIAHEGPAGAPAPSSPAAPPAPTAAESSTIDPAKVADAFERFPAHDERGVRFLEGRGLWPLDDSASIVRFHPKDRSVVVPLLDAGGTIVNFQRRPPLPRSEIRGAAFLPLKGAPVKGTSFGKVDLPGDVWLVEGMTDHLAACRLAPALGVIPLGAPGVSNAVALVEARGHLLRGRRVFVSFDNDDPGRRAAEETAAALRNVGANPLVVRYPGGFNDLAEILEQVGLERAIGVVREMWFEANRSQILPGHAAAEVFSAEGQRQPAPSTPSHSFPPAEWRQASQILRTRPPLERIATGIVPLDRATRGGLPLGLITMIQGPPGSAKTTLAAQIGLRAALDGAIVIAMFVDEGVLAAAIRQGQQLGLDIRALEEGDPEALAALEERLAGVGFYFADPDETTLEAEIRNLRGAPPGRKRMLLVDSAHVARCERAEQEPSGRGRLDAVVSVLRAGALELPMHVIATAEVTKGSYSHKDDSENTAELAASAESRKLAYASRLILAMKEEAPRVFRVAVVKNTPGLGVKPAFRMELDPARALLAPIADEQAEREVEASRAAAAATAIAEAEARVHKALRIALERGEEWLSTTKLEKEAGGRAGTVREAAARLAAADPPTVERDDRGPGKGVFWRLVTRENGPDSGPRPTPSDPVPNPVPDGVSQPPRPRGGDPVPVPIRDGVPRDGVVLGARTGRLETSADRDGVSG